MKSSNFISRLKDMTVAHLFLLCSMVFIIWGYVGNVYSLRISLGMLLNLALLAIPVLLFFTEQKNMREIIGGLATAAGVLGLFFGLKILLGKSPYKMDSGLMMIQTIKTVASHAPYLAVLAAGLRILLGKKMPNGVFKLLCSVAFVFSATMLIMSGTVGAALPGKGAFVDTMLQCVLTLGYMLLPGQEFGGQRKDFATIGTLVLLVMLIVVGYSMSQIDFAHFSDGASGGSDSRVCKNCGRTFTDSANKNSIARTGMCKNCYNNFQWGMEATGRDTAWHIHGENEDCESMTLTFRSTEETELQELLCKLEPAADWSDAA